MRNSVLEINRISKNFDGKVNILSDVSFSLFENEVVGILGPSGSGKSTLLRLIAGLELPDSGIINLNGTDVSGIAPHKRGVGLMFQDLSLFPHLNVFDNIAFGLKMDNWQQTDIKNRVDELLSFLRIDHLQTRSTDSLSGGESQRVALARALAPNPPLLMLDEPLGSLDRKLRHELLREMKDLIASMGLSVLYVTHDQEEAFSIGERIILLNNGSVEQIDSPIQMITRPGSRFVADFVGTLNMIPVELLDRNNKIFVDGFVGVLELPKEKLVDSYSGDKFTLIISPYSIILGEQTTDSLLGTIKQINVGPGYLEYEILLDSQNILVARQNIGTNSPELRKGDSVPLRFNMDEVELLPW